MSMRIIERRFELQYSYITSIVIYHYLYANLTTFCQLLIIKTLRPMRIQLAGRFNGMFKNSML